jgi:hypothetical protein
MQIADTSADSGFTLIRIPCSVEVIFRSSFFEMKSVARVTKLIVHPIVAHYRDHCLCRRLPAIDGLAISAIVGMVQIGLAGRHFRGSF